MKALILGIAAMIVLAAGFGYWLDGQQKSAAERYTAATSVRL